MTDDDLFDRLRARGVVVDPEAVAVVVVRDVATSVGRLLVAAREHALPVDIKRDRRRVQGVPGKRVDGELVLVPAKRLAQRQCPVDRDGLEP